MHLSMMIFVARLVNGPGTQPGAWLNLTGQWICLLMTMVLTIALYAPGIHSTSSLNCWYAFVMVSISAILTPFATHPQASFGMPLFVTASVRLPASVYATRFSLVFILNVMSSTLIILQHWYYQGEHYAYSFNTAALVEVASFLLSCGTWMAARGAFYSRARHQIRSGKMATDSGLCIDWIDIFHNLPPVENRNIIK